MQLVRTSAGEMRFLGEQVSTFVKCKNTWSKKKILSTKQGFDVLWRVGILGIFRGPLVNVRKLCTDNTKWNLVFKMTDRPAKSGCIYNFLSSFQCIIVISSQFTFLHRGGISQTNPWDFWSSRFGNFENCESLNFNLGQKKMEQKTPIPPNQGRSREKSKRRHWSLILDPWFGGEAGYEFPIHFVQNCMEGVNVT